VSAVACIGEAMLELRPAPHGAGEGLLACGVAGDVYNMAVYLKRSDPALSVAFLTALGDDPGSDQIAAAVAAEGLDGGAVARRAGEACGMYRIAVDPAGERRFSYWRSDSAARRMMRDAGGWSGRLRGAAVVAFSAITLAVLEDDAARAALRAMAAAARASGARVAFDSNHRPRLWRDAPAARDWHARACAVADIALVTADDEAALFGDAGPQDALARLAGCGVAERVVKLGADGALVAWGGAVETVPAPARLTPVDTTAAGDSFNAAYLAARLAGAAPAAAAARGHALAARVVMHPGAILPRA